MHWLTIAGFCLCIAGVVLSSRQYLLGAKPAGRQGDRVADRYMNGVRQDLYQGTVWLGIAFMLVSQIAQQLGRGAPANELILSLAAGAATVFSCGLCAGRLVARRQWWLEIANEPRV